MRIRKKAVKPARSRPVYIVGYSGVAPALAELRVWFDREYGGPLRPEPDLRDASLSAAAGPVMVSHGPWAAVIESVSEEEAARWGEGLQWSHPSAMQIGSTAGQASYRIDQALHVARLARGLTLLTQGTAYDLARQTYLNPSDWRDRSLEQFTVSDHVIVTQADAPTPEREWFSTRGLTRFGLDEIEAFRPVGLPAGPVIEALMEISGALIRLGRLPNVGSTLRLQELGLVVDVLHHRTVQVGVLTIPIRELAWKPLGPQS
jgi:hypothetical protein